MRCLIIEDNSEKLKQILLELKKHKCESVDQAKSATAARALLTKNQYQLVLLDVVIPNFDNDRESVQCGLDLLREIHEAEYILRPNYIVGLTGFLEVAKSTKHQFENMLWTLIHYESKTNNWRKMLEKIILHIRKASDDAPLTGERVDLAIVTALKDPEFSAVMKLPWSWQPPEPLDNQTFIRRGVISCDGKNYTVVAAHAPRMGMVDSALLSSKIIRTFRPKLLAMVGICAGRKGQVQLCDVVVSSVSWDWQSGKYTISEDGSTFQIEPDFIKCSEGLRAKIELIDLSAKTKIFYPDGGPSGATSLPGILPGPMPSGSAVISDASVMDKILKQNRKTIAVDMECYGMYCSAYRATKPQPEFICIKSVSDFGDEFKHDNVQEKCAMYSAQTLRYLVEKYAHEIFM